MFNYNKIQYDADGFITLLDISDTYDELGSYHKTAKELD